jgi:FAD/FMN-containing dehydrogenase
MAIINGSVAALAERVKGRVLRRGDKDFPAEVSGFQQAVTHRPEVVVGAAHADDVRAAVAFAAEHGLPVAVQSSGHGVTVALDGGVLITTGRMTGVEIDPDARTARIEAGARWADVTREAAPHGLMPPSGSAPNVGALGYTLGGGTPLLGRTIGYAADHVRALDVVGADGTARRVTADSDPDLFWALRGGRDNFGVVTALSIGLVPVRTLYAGGLYFDAAGAAGAGEVFERYRTWSAGLPDEVTTSIGMLAYPPVPALPEPLRGRHVVHVRFVAVGPADAAESLLAPLRALGPRLIDRVGEIPVTEAGSVYSEPDFPHGYYGGNVLLTGLDRDALAAVVAMTGPGGEASGVVDLRHLGGAMAREPDVPSAVPYREAQYVLRVIGMVDGDADVASVRDAHERVYAAVAPWTLGRSVNFLYGAAGPTEFVDRIYPPQTLRRLARIKATCDPRNMFRGTHNVLPAPD